MLQCHPYPNESVDTSKQCSHCAFFMGLQRKQGVRVHEGQQFDIRVTVDKFKHSVNLYMFWKPGMEIFVSHVRRRQIPSFVFLEGYKRSQSAKLTIQLKAENSSEDRADDWECGSSDGWSKGKRFAIDDDAEPKKPEKQSSVGPDQLLFGSPEVVNWWFRRNTGYLSGYGDITRYTKF